MKNGGFPILLLSVLAFQAQSTAQAAPDGPVDQAPVLSVDFSNPALAPARWSLVFHPDGSGHFHSETGQVTAAQLHTIEPGPIDREVQLGPDFSAHAFETVRRHKFFSEGCESHLKVAFQGWKTITYTGPDGHGSCEFNYSTNRDIQSLGESFLAVASTIVEGARIELLMHHDRLSLDREMDYLEEATADGRLQQIGAIQGVLTRLIDDPDVMERVRRRARLLLATATK